MIFLKTKKVDPIKRTVLANYYTHLEKSEPGGGKIDLDRNITLGTSNGNNLPGSGGLNAVSPHSETQDDCDGSIDSFEEASHSQPPSPRTGYVFCVCVWVCLTLVTPFPFRAIKFVLVLRHVSAHPEKCVRWNRSCSRPDWKALAARR